MRGHLTVIDGGFSTTVQDRGRTGSQRFGVSACGAMDLASLAIANALVGNAEDAAALELTFSGGAYRVDADALRIAVAGAAMPLMLDGAPADPQRSHTVGRGTRIDIGPSASGVRAYLAVSGGVATQPVLASRSTHLRSAIGGYEGRALRGGDELPVGGTGPTGVDRRLRHDRRPYFGGVIRIVPGPQDDAFADGALDLLTSGRYRISPQSDRMGAVLSGPSLPFRGGFNLVSDGVTMGSIQVPGHGRPIVLLSDRQTTGGYPKIATVTTPDLGKFAQRRPNERVVFHAVSPDEAEERYIAWRAALDDIPDWLEPA
ncbi:MAG: biotin-dependent carboxyltransferase family protein [Rhizobiaceae bacterium]|nr:biotin-dependent carboxyltransferase family protein [Rhizobiaceae bacterium]